MGQALNQLVSGTKRKSALSELVESGKAEPDRDVFQEGVKEFNAASLVNEVIRGQRNPDQPEPAPVFSPSTIEKRPKLAHDPDDIAKMTPEEVEAEKNRIGIAESIRRYYGSDKPGRTIPGWVQDLPVTVGPALSLFPATAPVAVPATIAGMIFKRGASSSENIKIIQAMNRLKSGDIAYELPAGHDPLLRDLKPEYLPARGSLPEGTKYNSKEEDEKLVIDWLKWVTEADRRGMTAPAQVQQGISMMIPWMAEFYATRGLAKLGDAAGENAIKYLLGKYGGSKAAKAIERTAGIAGGGVLQGGVGFVPMSVETATRRQAEQATGLRKPEGWATSTMKAVGDSIIQAASERTGEHLTQGLGWAIRKVPGGSRILNALEKKWTAITGRTAGDFADQIATQAGYSNIIGEIGEEGVADALTAAFGIEDFGAGDDATTAQRLNAAMGQFFQNIPVMATTFAIPGIAKTALRYTMPQPPTPLAIQTRYEDAVSRLDIPKYSQPQPEEVTTAAEAPKPPTMPQEQPISEPTLPTPPSETDQPERIRQFKDEARRSLDPSVFEEWESTFDRSIQDGLTPDQAFYAADERAVAVEQENKDTPKQAELFDTGETKSKSNLESLFDQAGIVSEWGTRNQYYVNNPYRNQLDEFKKTGKYDEKVLHDSEKWEMEQVLKNKPAYLNDSHFLTEYEIFEFARQNNLVTGRDNLGYLIVAKDQDSLDRVITAKGQRELGIALGYEDISQPYKIQPKGAEDAVQQVQRAAETQVIPEPARPAAGAETKAPAAPLTDEEEEKQDIQDAQTIGKYLSDQPMTSGIRNRIVGDLRKKIWESPAIEDMQNLAGRVFSGTQDITVPSKNATDIREQVNSIQDPRVRQLVKERVHYAKPGERQKGQGPDQFAAELTDALGYEVSESDVIPLMEMALSVQSRQGTVPEAVKTRIRKSGDPYMISQIRILEKIDRFQTIGEYDEFVAQEYRDFGIRPEEYAQDLYSYQDIAQERIAKIKDPQKRKKALRRAAVLSLLKKRRTKAEKAAVEILEREGIQRMNISGEIPDQSSDEIPFEKRGQRPVGAYYLNAQGKATIGLALGSDEETGAHEAYHVLEPLLPTADQRLLIKEISQDPEARATAFADFYLRNEKPKLGIIRAIFEKIARILRRIRDGLLGRGIRRAQDVFGDILAGRETLIGKPQGPETIQFERTPYEPSDREIEQEMFDMEREIERKQKRRQYFPPKILPPKAEGDQARKTAPLFPGKLKGGELRVAGGMKIPKGPIPGFKEGGSGTPPLGPGFVESASDEGPEFIPSRGPVGPQSRPRSWYESNLKPTKTPFWQKLKQETREFALQISKLTQPVSYRLEKIDPELFRMVRHYEYTKLQRIAEFYDRVVPYLRLTKKMTPENRKILNMALPMGDRKIVDGINATIPGAKEAYEAARDVLNEIFEWGESVGIDMNFIYEYWPRVIKDQKGLSREFGKTDWSVIQRAVADIEDGRQRALTDEELAEVLNTLIHTGKIGKYLSRSTDPTSPRRLEELPADILRHYHDYATAMGLYITKMVERITRREFFNRMDPSMTALLRRRAALLTRMARLRSRKPDEKASQESVKWYNNRIAGMARTLQEVQEKIKKHANADDKSTVGGFLGNLVMQGKLDGEKERDAEEALLALFNPGHVNPLIKAFMNLTYMDTLDSPIIALSNLKDMAIAYSRSMVGASGAIPRVLTGKDRIALRSLGIRVINEEFSRENIYTITRQIMGVSLQGVFDRMGKRITVETAYTRYRKQAEQDKPSKDFLYRIGRALGPDKIQKAIADLRSGEITDDIRFLMFNEISDIQPISQAERPEFYLRHANGRILYMLRGVTLRQLNYAVKEARMAMKIGGKAGALLALGRLVKIAMWAAILGAGIDVIKDILRGREVKDLSPYFIQNLLQYSLIFNRYTVRTLEEEGVSGVVGDTLPPFQFWDSLVADLFENDPEKKGEITRTIPIFGDMYYWWFGKGSRREQEKRMNEWYGK